MVEQEGIGRIEFGKHAIAIGQNFAQGCASVKARVLHHATLRKGLQQAGKIVVVLHGIPKKGHVGLSIINIIAGRTGSSTPFSTKEISDPAPNDDDHDGKEKFTTGTRTRPSIGAAVAAAAAAAAAALVAVH
jgi:hypothetical protein